MDPDVFSSIQQEAARQADGIELIASENYVSPAILEAQGSILTNKYAEGYPGRRYYGGCQYVDEVESLALSRVKELFQCAYANVQPHSGSQANQAVFLALLKPGDTVMGMDLAAGGHLTHGSPVNLSGRWFSIVSYGVNPETKRIDMEAARRLAHEKQPKLIIAGASAYSRFIDFEGFRRIADEVGAILLVDMAHIAGLVAGGAHPSPLPWAHVVTSTTHKTLRGPRGGLILANDLEMGARLDKALFPGLQGGPLMHVIAAKAVCFGEALQPAFKDYAHQVVRNAQAMANTFEAEGLDVVTHGTDNHLLLVDVTPMGKTGHEASLVLEDLGLTCNKNAIPFDPRPPRETSGIRLGTAAITTRGFQENDCQEVAHLIVEALRGGDAKGIKERVGALCRKYPLNGR